MRMRDRVTALAFVAATAVCSVFVVAGLVSVVYCLVSNALRPGSVQPQIASPSDALVMFTNGGLVGNVLAVGGIVVMSVASWMRPLLFEGRIQRIIMWAALAVLVLFVCIAVDVAVSDSCLPGGLGMVLGSLAIIVLTIGFLVTTKRRLSGH
jgi:hypothetical protein